MEGRYHRSRDLTMEGVGLSLEELRGQPLELVAREGAQLLLRVAMEAEVTEFLGRLPYERTGDGGRGYRNGHRERRVKCAAGEVTVQAPRVSDTVEPFRSGLLRAWERRSRVMEEVLPLLYVEGLSTRDFRRALRPLWGESGLSRSTISRANGALKEAFRAWRERDLSLEEIIYLFLDGIYLRVRKAGQGKDAVLVAHGITREGKRVVLHISLGGRESTESWKGMLHDLDGRGLICPLLIISDGNPGLLRAIADVWPKAPWQRCMVHRTWNVLARVPKKRQEEVEKALHRTSMPHRGAQEEAQRFVARYGKEFPTAVEVLGAHLEESLTFYRFPERHWKFIRTSNVLERSFREVKRRTNVIGRFPTEMAALSVVFGVLEEERLKWKGVRMKAEDIAWIDEAVKSLDSEPITLEAFEAAVVQAS